MYFVFQYVSGAAITNNDDEAGQPWSHITKDNIV